MKTKKFILLGIILSALMFLSLGINEVAVPETNGDVVYEEELQVEEWMTVPFVVNNNNNDSVEKCID